MSAICNKVFNKSKMEVLRENLRGANKFSICHLRRSSHYTFNMLKNSGFVGENQGALNEGWWNEAISAFHDRCRSIFYRFCALKYWYFPSQMERSWYFPSQIERSVAARAALEVTKWNAESNMFIRKWAWHTFYWIKTNQIAMTVGNFPIKIALFCDVNLA